MIVCGSSIAIPWGCELWEGTQEVVAVLEEAGTVMLLLWLVFGGVWLCVAWNKAIARRVANTEAMVTKMDAAIAEEAARNTAAVDAAAILLQSPVRYHSDSD